MRQIREVLRLKWGCGLSHRAIAKACSVGLGTVSDYLTRAKGAGVPWPLPEELDRTVSLGGGHAENAGTMVRNV